MNEVGVIDREVLTGVRNGICAIGYITIPLAAYIKDVSSPFFKVLGTGFLVRPTTVITNRHVVEALGDAQAETGFPDDQRLLMFVTPGKESPVNVSLIVPSLTATLANKELDVGFLEFDRDPEVQFSSITPLHVQPKWSGGVTQTIALCGYPYGHAMLQRDRKVFRWGPVVQRGYISAVSPYDTMESPSEILLDIRAAGGMSGAPAFRPQDGTVVGILFSGWEATTAQCLVLTVPTVQLWLSYYDQTRKQASR